MLHIDTETEKIIVEIDGSEYELAEKTIETADRLLALEAQHARSGQAMYKLWLDELRLLLGENAMREIFPNGKKENVDRIQAIYAGVAEAFDHRSMEISHAPQEKQISDTAAAIAPINELLRNIRQIK